MAERKYYVLCSSNCKFESMTKEQILTAIEQAVSDGVIKDVDTGFITKLKELNKGGYISVWRGTTAEYNALTEKDENCIYVKTDDTQFADINNAIDLLRKTTEEELAGKAPAGFGIGEKIARGKFEDIDATGFFNVYDSIMPNYDRNQTHLVEVIDGGASGPLGTAKYLKAVSSKDGTILHRVESYKTNYEWRYQNPPLNVTAEGLSNIVWYKTIECFNGKSLITGILQTTWGAGKTLESDEISITPIKYTGHVKHTALPFINGTLDNADSCWVTVRTNDVGHFEVKMHGGAALNGQPAYIQIWALDYIS